MARRKLCSARAASGNAAAWLMALVLAAAGGSALPARAGGVSASLAVTVVVPPRALVEVESEPEALRITEEDVTRGYVEKPRASRIRVRTNTPAGWLLELQVAEGPFRSIEVTGVGAPAHVRASGGWIAQPYPGTTRPVFLEVGFRFFLSPDARPGLYRWPVALSAIPR